MALWQWRGGNPARVVDPTGRLVATKPLDSRPQVVEVWDAASGHRLAALPGQTATVNDLAFGPDGRLS